MFHNNFLNWQSYNNFFRKKKFFLFKTYVKFEDKIRFFWKGWKLIFLLLLNSVYEIIFLVFKKIILFYSEASNRMNWNSATGMHVIVLARLSTIFLKFEKNNRINGNCKLSCKFFQTNNMYKIGVLCLGRSESVKTRGFW